MSAGPGFGKRPALAGVERGSLLVGRDVERARLDALLDAARAGRSEVLVVRGEAGVGKTTLLDYAAGRAIGIRVLRARGVEAESGLAFAALDELLRPVLSCLDGLPERQAAALRGALALSEASEVDRFAVYVATLGLLATAAEKGPLLVLIDDAQWLDGSSAEALVFAGRRLEAEGIALVFAAREGDPDEFVAPGLDELHVHGLDRDAVARLLALRAAGPVPSAVLDRLTAETAGNPLVLLELSNVLTPGQLAGDQPLDEPLAAGEAAKFAFLHRAQALSAPAREALVLAATAGDGDLAPLLVALDAARLGTRPLAEAEAAGLVRIAEGRLSFQHPLVRSAVYAAADPPARRRAHRAMADAVGELRPDRRAWHLARAAIGPDEEVAAALEKAAVAARRRSGYAAAAVAYERAARLSPPGTRRVERLVAGGEAARRAGRSEHAAALLRQAAADATEDRVRAEISHKRGRLEWFAGRPRQAERLFVDAAGLVGGSDPMWSALLLVEASLAAGYAGDAAGAVAIARRARARELEGAASIGADAALSTALYWAGEGAQAHLLLLGAIAAVDARDLAALDPEAVLFAANWSVYTGTEVRRARMLVDRVLDEARASGALWVLSGALNVSAQLLLREGEWAQAYAAAGEGARIAAEVDNALQRRWLLGLLALVEAAQGREAECRAHVEEAQMLIAGTEFARPPELGEALGLLELGLGRPELALAHLEEATAAGGGPGARRLSRPAVGDLVEARLHHAGEVPDELMTAVVHAGDGDFEGCAAVVERCRALVAGEDEFDARFGRALKLHGGGWPFARARTQLCYGERLRRAGRRIDARAQLRTALETFERLGARPWAERASDELRATGERIARRDPTASERLTPQELQIALTVARGATNREAGAALFLSPKTIEFHLGRVYRKLGLRSRTELAHTLRDTLRPEPAGDA